MWEGSEVARWVRWKSNEVAEWEAPGFIERFETQGGFKISSFCFSC